MTRADYHDKVDKALNLLNRERQYPLILGHLTSKLIAEKSTPDFSSRNGAKLIDIVRDVINLVPAYFVATELLGLPLKTQQTPNGLFRDTECADMLAEICK